MKRLLFLLSVFVLAVGVAACGGDDDSDALVTPEDQPEAGAEPTDDTDDGDTDDIPDIGTDDSPPEVPADIASTPDGPTGSGTATIDGETITFDVMFCGFGPDEIGNPNGIFALFGGDEAADLRVDVTRSMDPLDPDPDSDTMDIIDFTYGSQADPDRSFSALNIPPMQPSFLEIDGNSVSATAEFYDADDPVGTMEGTFEATCP